jgi:adenosine deaminase CECR1
MFPSQISAPVGKAVSPSPSSCLFHRPGGATQFDEELYNNLTITQTTDQPHATGNDMWAAFQPIFTRVRMAYQYLPVFRSFFRLMFDKLFEDGIIRWEMRTSLSPVYDERGEYLTQEETLAVILEELNHWKAEDPQGRSIFSVGIVMQGIRSGTVSEVTEALLSAYSLRDAYPEILIGFDLVGQEDPGKTLLYWAPILLNITDSMPSPPMPFYFHAGESNQLDVQTNLVDAIYLKTRRIGHGFGVPEFPALWPLIARQGVLIESNPISNQVLGLVVDQRNHPIGHMLRHALHNVFWNQSPSDETSPSSEVNQYSPHWKDLLSQHPSLAHFLKNRVGIPSLAVSVSNDDPGFWDIDAIVSYDWYVAVLAWELSLSGIKQLAIDSIVHSGASLPAKGKMLLHWFESWELWVEEVNRKRSVV